MKRVELIGIIGQWASLFIASIGIIVEIKYEAHCGHYLITIAAVLLAIATKLRYYWRRR